MKIAFHTLLICFFSLSCQHKTETKVSDNKTALSPTGETIAIETMDKDLISKDDAVEVTCDTAVINNIRFMACHQKGEHFFIVNENRDTIYKHPDWINETEFIDFNGDGFKDILFHYITNVPDIYDLVLFDEPSNTFRLVEDFQSYPAPKKIKGSRYYYSYHRSGCADSNWDSDLFYIENFKIIRIANIRGIGCEGEGKNGIFIFKLKRGKKELVKEIVRKPGYYDDKWAFIDEYWKGQYQYFANSQ